MIPSEISAASVLSAREDVTELAVGNEMVLIAGAAHVLNPTAALVWQCLDGEGTIEEIVADLAEATGAPASVILDDVLTLVQSLGQIGLLDGVAEPVPEPVDTGWVPPSSVAEGTEFPEFMLPDLDGSDVALSSLRGRQVLLVNWSPGCGFCTRIAGDLGAMQDALVDRGVDMVFVTSGEVDRNRSVFDDAGIKATAVLRDGNDPFAGFGTPAAYLLDESGVVSTAFAYGADQVPLLARQAAGLSATAPLSGVRYLPAAAAVCGGGGGGGGKSTGWEGTAAFAFDDVHAGIRYNSASTLDVLFSLFEGRRVDDERAPDNYSVALYGGGGRSRELNLLVRGSQQLVRSRSQVRVLSALLAYLSADLGDPASKPDGALELRVAAVAGAAGVVLVPAGVTVWTKELQPRLARAGLQFVDVPAVFVDPGSASLVVPAPALPFSAAALEGLDAGVKLGSELPAVMPGSYPIKALLQPMLAEDATPATVVASLVPLVAGGADAWEQLPGLVSRITVSGLDYDGPESLAKSIVAASR